MSLKGLAASEIRRWIEAALVPDSWWRVLDGRPASEAERKALLDARNLEGVGSFTGSPYGLTIRRSGMRALPTAMQGQKVNDEDGFDRLQHTALEPLTPLALLHASRDRRWWFALAPDYRGWVRAADVAVSPHAGPLREIGGRPGPVRREPLAALNIPGGKTPVQLGDSLPGLAGAEMPFPIRAPPGGRARASNAAQSSRNC